MNAIARLKRDHVILRAKLDVLESALRMGPDTWFVLREVCFTLAKQLRDHIHREEALIAACRKALDPAILAHIQLEHQDEPQHLRTINRLFVQEPGHTLEQIRPELTGMINGLRRHITEEETVLFPTIERALRAQGVETITTGAPSRLHETMTVNRVVQEHPCARRIFERLFISIPFEGCSGLDEVAWRHGMESKDLIAALDAALASDEAHGSLEAQADNSAECCGV